MKKEKPSWRIEARQKNQQGKPGQWWVVVRNDGHIANNHWHTAEEEAARHSEKLNVFFGSMS